MAPYQPPSSHYMDLCLVISDSTPPCFVNSRSASHQLGFLTSLFNLQYINNLHNMVISCQGCTGQEMVKIKNSSSSGRNHKAGRNISGHSNRCKLKTNEK